MKQRKPFSTSRSFIRINPMRFMMLTDHMTKRQFSEMLDRACREWMRGNADLFKEMPGFLKLVLYADVLPRFIPKHIRLDVLKDGKCAECGSPERLTVDHIRPLSKGGTHERHNLRCLCMDCNQRKGAKWEEVG